MVNMVNLDSRIFTEMGLESELNKIKENYMKIWDEYYDTGSRESAFLKDLADTMLGISAIFEVYTRDKSIYPGYALEKLNNAKSYIDENIRFFESKLEKKNLKKKWKRKSNEKKRNKIEFISS